MGKWTQKDERQYEKIKESSRDRGVSIGRAKEIAAATVNKKRRQERRTPKKQSEGTGNPNQSLDDRAKDELLNIARDMEIPGRSKMNKEELVREIRKRR